MAQISAQISFNLTGAFCPVSRPLLAGTWRFDGSVIRYMANTSWIS